MSDPYACLTCGDCHPGPCLPPVLPTPGALRTILDVTVHAGECEKVLRAYTEGRLIDGQAITDVWNGIRQRQPATARWLRNQSPELADLLDDNADALTEEDTDE